MQRLDTKHRTELKRVGKVRSHWGPRDLFWHLITEEEEGGCNQGEESTEQKYERTVGKEWHNTQPRMRKNLVFVKDGTVQLKPKCGSSFLSRVIPNISIYYQKYGASIITPNTVPLK